MSGWLKCRTTGWKNCCGVEGPTDHREDLYQSGMDPTYYFVVIQCYLTLNIEGMLIAMMAKQKQAVNTTLNGTKREKAACKIVDATIITLIISNVIAVIIEPSVRNPAVLRFLNIFEVVSVIVFSIEYLLRLWVADIDNHNKSKFMSRIAFIVTPMALIDLAAILPFYIPLIITTDLRVLRMLRIFRLLRIFKTNRYTSALSTVFQVIT